MADIYYPFDDSSELLQCRITNAPFSNSLSLSPIFVLPENPKFDLTSSDSEPEPCDLDLDLDFDFDQKEEEDHDQVILVTDLFQRSSEIDESNLDLSLGLGSDDSNRVVPGESEGVGFEVDLELGLGLGFYQPTRETPHLEGLRVVRIDSDSDSEDGVSHDFDMIDDGFRGASDFDRPPFCWDYLGFNNPSNSSEHRVREIDLPNLMNDDDDDDDDTFYGHSYEGYGDNGEQPPISLDTDSEREVTEVSILFDTYQEGEEHEVTIESDEGEEEFDVDLAIRELEWEILLAVNNFSRELYDMDFNMNAYESILGEVEERMNEWRGSPPASNSFIDNLPLVRVSPESLEENNGVVCAICKDEISGEEPVRKLPCSHYYHGDCILPWLKIRNTCPVCRYELPTDDPDYECRKREREGLNAAAADVSLDLQVRYDFQVFL